MFDPYRTSYLIRLCLVILVWSCADDVDWEDCGYDEKHRDFFRLLRRRKIDVFAVYERDAFLRLFAPSSLPTPCPKLFWVRHTSMLFWKWASTYDHEQEAHWCNKLETTTTAGAFCCPAVPLPSSALPNINWWVLLPSVKRLYSIEKIQWNKKRRFLADMNIWDFTISSRWQADYVSFRRMKKEHA